MRTSFCADFYEDSGNLVFTFGDLSFVVTQESSATLDEIFTALKLLRAEAGFGGTFH